MLTSKLCSRVSLFPNKSSSLLCRHSELRLRPMAKALGLVDNLLATLTPHLSGSSTMATAAEVKATAILGMGNPLLDISSPVKQEFLDKYGVKVDNAILAEESHIPMYEEMSAMDTVEYIGGGSTLNSMRVAQWMLSGSGVPEKTVSFFGCIGCDDYGKTMKKLCLEAGVNAHFMEHKTVPTGTCAVCILKKERSLIANLAAANEFKLDHLSTKESQSIIDQSGIVYAAGFFVTVSPESMVTVGKQCKSEKKVFAINLSAEFIVSVFKDALSTVLPFATHIFSNEDEIQAFAKANEIEYSSISELAQKVAALPSERSVSDGDIGRTVVVTQGSKSVVVAQPDGSVEQFPVPRMDGSLIVDTNGAGDGFVGGFLSQMALGRSVERCVQAGVYSAQYIIRRSGTKLEGSPDFE